MVIAAASTGRERSNKITVTKIAHAKSGIRSRIIPLCRMLKVVDIKLMAPKIEEIPAKCREKIARSTDAPEWAVLPARGGYTVHPVPAPDSTREELKRRVREGGRSQNLILLSRGNAISGAASINGKSQLPKPPIAIGITKKKIITNAWAVTITL